MAIDGGLFVARTDDGGKEWKPLRRGLPQACAYDVGFVSTCEDFARGVASRLSGM